MLEVVGSWFQKRKGIMTKAEIRVRVGNVLAKHLGGVQVTDDLVVGKILNADEGLRKALTRAVHVGLYTNTPTTTVADLVKEIEEEWDRLADWERR